MLSPTDIRLHIHTFCLLRPKDLQTIIREQVITVKETKQQCNYRIIDLYV